MRLFVLVVGKHLECMKDQKSMNGLRKTEIVHFVVKIVIIKYVLKQSNTFLDKEIELVKFPLEQINNA